LPKICLQKEREREEAGDTGDADADRVLAGLEPLIPLAKHSLLQLVCLRHVLSRDDDLDPPHLESGDQLNEDGLSTTMTLHREPRPRGDLPRQLSPPPHLRPVVVVE